MVHIKTDRFVRVKYENAQTYRDAVEFKNGLKLRLQDLEEGQSVEVLALFREDRCSGGVHSKQTLSTAPKKR